MTHAALQDAVKGHGLCIINPKGGMIDEFLAKLSADREDDVIYINPNRRRVPAINVLEPHVTPAMTQPNATSRKTSSSATSPTSSAASPKTGATAGAPTSAPCSGPTSTST